jgi:hypothetical protein
LEIQKAIIFLAPVRRRLSDTEPSLRLLPPRKGPQKSMGGGIE